MNCVITSDALELYLSDIKKMHETYDFKELSKIIFINPDSFFNYLSSRQEAGESGKSFNEIMESIEPFIPLVINDDNLNTYLLTAISKDESELIRLQKQFIQNAKISFVSNVFSAQTDEDLEDIFEICRTIREYREKAVFV